MKRTEQLAKTRTAIMETATKLFLKKGYALTSTRDIAKEIGITQPALYHHFSDKEVLYLDVLYAHCSKVRQQINQVMRRDNLSAKDRLWEITEAFTKNHPNNVYNNWQSTASLLSPSGRRKLEIIFMMDYIEPVSEFFKLPEAHLRPDILPKEAAELFIADLTPLFGSLQQLGGKIISNEQRGKIILDVFLNGVMQHK